MKRSGVPAFRRSGVPAFRRSGVPADNCAWLSGDSLVFSIWRDETMTAVPGKGNFVMFAQIPVCRNPSFHQAKHALQTCPACN